MNQYFLDTNILLRYLTRDDETLCALATDIMKRIEAEEISAYISQIVIAECVFTLEKSYKQTRASVMTALSGIISLPNIKMDKKDRILQSLNLHAEKNIPYPDAYLIIRMQELKVTEIYSFDEDIDKVKTIKRLNKY